MEAFFLILAIALTPIYTFESGGLQMSHMALALFMMMKMMSMQWRATAMETLLVALVLLVLFRESYSVVVEDGTAASLLQVLYVTFSLAVVVTVSRMPVFGYQLGSTMKKALALSVVLAVAGVLYFGVSFVSVDGELNRSVGTFNNPNQLGYFAVCTSCLVSLWYLRGGLSRLQFAGFLASVLVLAIASLSKAAMLSTAAQIAIAIGAMASKRRSSVMLFVVIAVVALLLLQLYLSGAFQGFEFFHRLQTIGADKDDNLAERGYLSPLDFTPLQFLFGLGVAGAKAAVGHEVHSTFWSFMVKYGVVGFTLFISVWLLWAKSVYRELGLLGVLAIVLPPTLYGIPHNGSRFAILWILVALSLNGIRSARSRPESENQARDISPAPWRALQHEPSIPLARGR